MSCANSCPDSEIKYRGNGSQTLFTFPFEYMEESDVDVDIFDETTQRWINADDPQWSNTYFWSFENATTIKFRNAPPAPVSSDVDFNIKIYRCTNIDPLKAQFNPGSAIRARDLNDNFEQLQLAIIEGRCQIPRWLYDYLDDNYWNKSFDTNYYEDQTTGVAEVNDEHIFTAKAAAARHDAYVQDNRPPLLPYEQPGKAWYDTDDLKNLFWDADIGAWVNFSSTGPQGPKGEKGDKGDKGDPGQVEEAPNDGNVYGRQATGNRGQWINLSGFAPGGGGGKTYNFIKPLIEDGNSVKIDLVTLNNA